MALMDHYLKLEQLRFGFTYHILADAAINKDAIEVPSLLLQPVIENAVKHGISGLYEDGLLRVHCTVKQNDLVVTVEDNGAGYEANNNPAGYGLKLTRERITLINKILREQSIEWGISKKDNGTTVHFEFKNWLL
jgi:LytS/YehU family sensor histidine kinase